MFTSFKNKPPDVVIVWGCDPQISFQRQWMLELLRPYSLNEVTCYEGDYDGSCNFSIEKGTLIIIVEAGVYIDSDSFTDKQTNYYLQLRKNRLDTFREYQNLLLWHIGDEQGHDGDKLYLSLPDHISIVREFPLDRYDNNKQLKNKPLGPTPWTLLNTPWVASSKREFAWSFIGTMWEGTSRKKALECFIKLVPDGYVNQGDTFGKGIQPQAYTSILLDSIFVLCPEGHFHFETFRFYETLQLGGIPLFITSPRDLSRLFYNPVPMPTFSNWEEAANFVLDIISNPEALDQLQFRLFCWWKNESNYQAKFFHEFIKK